jgi:fructose-bisphosphate aldolase class I
MELNDIVAHLMQAKKGILAADESNATATKRFEALGIESTPETRRAYREMLFSTPGIEQFLSGVILFDETLRQTSREGTLFPQYLSEKGMLPGIKVDQGLVKMDGYDDEFVTDGLEGLPARLAEYKTLGAAFTKWRAVIAVRESEMPTDPVIAENAKRLSAYAYAVLDAGMVPILEPEVLAEGAHSAERAEAIITRVMLQLFKSLDAHGILNKHVIIKTSMAIAGRASGLAVPGREVAERTVRALRASVPPDAGGVVFLSGGQSAREATENLNEIAKLAPHPWPVSFSFARALQGDALNAWKGKAEHVPEAQSLFFRRASLVAAAREGAYESSLED